MEAMTQEQRKKTKEALSRCGAEKPGSTAPATGAGSGPSSWPRSIIARRIRACGVSILQLRYMERRRREEVMDKLNISYSTYQKAHDDLLSTIAVFAAHYGEL